MKWQREVGLIKREELRWVPKKPNCEGGQGFISVGMNEIKPALYLLITGYGISISIIIAEATFTRLQQVEKLVEYKSKSENMFLILFEKLFQFRSSKQQKINDF